jgi:hypothetical protein
VCVSVLCVFCVCFEPKIKFEKKVKIPSFARYDRWAEELDQGERIGIRLHINIPIKSSVCVCVTERVQERERERVQETE